MCSITRAIKPTSNVSGKTMLDLLENPAAPNETVEKFYGKYPGVVSKNGPPSTGNGDYSGEIWVEVPGILEENQDVNRSGSGEEQKKPRQRPIQVLAKPCFPSGFFFIPEPGAQVWVEFVAGDLNCPIWTGVWYPPQGKTPKRTPRTIAGKAPTKFQKLIRTASGHVIQLDDTKDKEALIITDEKNVNKITMDINGIKIEDNNRNAIIMDSNGIKLETGTNAIMMDSSGVKVSDGTGKESLQLIVVEQLLTWLQAHQHTGNMGGPTPLFLNSLTPLTDPAQLKAFKSGK